MTKKEAKRFAYGQVIALLDVNIASGEGDLRDGVEEECQCQGDEARIREAFSEVLETIICRSGIHRKSPK